MKDMEPLNQMVEYALLFDFYGALLKEKNSSIFEDYMFNDMSLSEIAEEEGMTRQGVRDIVKRSGDKLIEYEEKLGLIKRFNSAKKSACRIKEETSKIKGISGDVDMCLIEIDKMTDRILDEL